MTMHLCGRDHDPEDSPCCECASVHDGIWGVGEWCQWKPETKPSALVEVRYVPDYLLDEYRKVGALSQPAYELVALCERSDAEALRRDSHIVSIDGVDIDHEEDDDDETGR